MLVSKTVRKTLETKDWVKKGSITRTWIENTVVQCDKHTTGKCYPLFVSVPWADVLLTADGQAHVSIIGVEKINQFFYTVLSNTGNICLLCVFITTCWHLDPVFVPIDTGSFSHEVQTPYVACNRICRTWFSFNFSLSIDQY